ncbi:MBL fold metallo-hydrolase [Dysgonomonas sp. HGC4]|uniref:MBL fold metallo-hydrolase n=1 Tax=Dysgonomonas sp. HGC4 TaxID=1658009 RepID=UPI000680C65A|nr:MBL fold metallo-hydrolase [Dysgonomonas sp. HGC4]MBD8347777.1 MBL fold metallo-hydrolase [Dysgonomonas sp. HGC4]
MWVTLSIIGVFAIIVFIFLQQAQFGRTPTGERLARVQNSTHYKDKNFQNQSLTPQLTGDKGSVKVMFDFLFGSRKRVTPVDEIPSIKTDLLNLDASEDILVWFGHSSYFIQIDGKRILVDPVFSGSASPVSFTTKAFKGADNYKTDDMPNIDYLFISHDHWDHLDYETIEKLKPKVGKVICSLGVGEHFEYWGYDINKIVEMDWNENAVLDSGFTAFCLPARHFSGRGLSPKQSLWSSFLLQTPTFKIYLGGDSGYDSHFASIGKDFEGIDLAILENGQYDNDWKYIHMMPEQVLQASKDLKAKRLLPVHSSKFALSKHAWDEPLIRITEANKNKEQDVITPMIGEIVHLKDTTQVFRQWWVGLE